ncbi:ABC transporter ATP-binding protein [Aliidiomarina sedimenti]|uniref:ABC transporter ATP-binding protein n=1 Tax=Aliidiomarina sedimenti TaxID=1933879 RepID=A0ABY0BXU1_9GAMM|nr:ATP-binding cassette domain-containing protein [Aliidiomarina sedimenti]RUO29247.1 ABC transporter ATP-binding protein [Aliidiomarina sedimenti]
MTISAQSISLQWSDGSVAFSDINFTLSPGFHALVGRNGCGKSSLLRVLAGDAAPPALLPTTGAVHRTGSVGFVSQNDQPTDASIADYLNAAPLLAALQRIAQGHVDEADFELVGDNWTYRDDLRQQLETLRLWDPARGFDKQVNQLSGGERTRLRLFQAFNPALNGNPVNLLLDEPGNHLDTRGRTWLLQQCKKFVAQPGHCLLLVSHDRSLLDHVESVSELTSLGLQRFEGNYNTYSELAGLQTAAVERQLQDAVKDKKRLQQTLQRTREKAEKRQAKGKADRSKGGQAKIMLDFAKENSQQSARARSTQMERQQSQAAGRLTDARQRLALMQDVQFQLPGEGSGAEPRKRRLLSCEQLVLPYGSQRPVTFTLVPGDKVRLLGLNGSGKSTLLNVLTKRLRPLSGALALNTGVHLLDQSFSLVDPARTVLDNLLNYSPQPGKATTLTTTTARTALAQAGLMADAVDRPAGYLSGGETMKLAMLMVTLQAEPGLLLFDEPDNHLDIQARRQLAQAIRGYPGALLLVSHDDHFVEDAGVSEHLELAL